MYLPFTFNLKVISVIIVLKMKYTNQNATRVCVASKQIYSNYLTLTFNLKVIAIVGLKIFIQLCTI